MATITLRSVKGVPLTAAEVDANFSNLNTDKIENADAVSTNTASKVVRRDASGNFSAGTITAALAGNASTATTADKVANTLTRGTYLTGDNFDGSAATTWAVDATSANTASKVVARDASGNFSAGTITASLTGNASTASTLQTGRLINGTSFNGSADITITANTTNTLTRGTYLTGNNFNGSAATTWAVDATSANTASKVVARDASGNFSAGVVTVTDLNSTSDRNQKDNIAPISNAAEIVNQLNGVSFNWKESGKKSYGVIAQEIEKVLPELVSQDEKGLTVSYIPLISILLEAVKSQEARISALESIINNSN